MEVSAIFVAMTHFLQPGSAFLKMSYYWLLERVEYKGNIYKWKGAESSKLFLISSQAYSISSSPVKKTKISPSGSS